MNPTNINEISVFVGDFCFLQSKKQKFRPIPIFLFKVEYLEDGVLLKGQDFESVSERLTLKLFQSQIFRCVRLAVGVSSLKGVESQAGLLDLN